MPTRGPAIGAEAGIGSGGARANDGGAATSAAEGSSSAGTKAAPDVDGSVGLTTGTGTAIRGGESKWMGFCVVAPVEERAEGRAGVSSGNSGKGLEGLGTKVRFINEGPSAGGTGKDFAFEKNAFMEAVLAAAKRG